MPRDSKQTITFEKARESIRFFPDRCTGCGTCELMCSLYRENSGGPALSRCKVIRDPFNGEYQYQSCEQCLAPSCYVACPEQNKALLIDPDSGIRYINEEECTGCKLCIKPCPLEAKRMHFNRETKKALMCDLCRERPDGPICVKYCPTLALQWVKKKKQEDQK
jgi:Fe-S-cluster-containing hydrogenase component 2